MKVKPDHMSNTPRCGRRTFSASSSTEGNRFPTSEVRSRKNVLQRYLETESLWQLLLLASKADSTVARAIVSGEPAHVAKYAFQLAQSFNTFYHDQPVITEEDPERRAFLLWLTQYVRKQLLRTLGCARD